MAYGDTTNLIGISGAQYVFTIFPRATHFKPNAGVYVMGRDVGDRRFEFCFVGQTGDLSVRPLKQDKIACFNSFGVDHIFIMEEPDERRRAQITDDLLQSYVPFCNMP